MVPFYGRKDLYSNNLVGIHFWLATTGILLYITSMWASGITQGLIWRSYNSNLDSLQYSFIEIRPMHPVFSKSYWWIILLS